MKSAKKSISRRRKKVYTGLIVFFGLVGLFVVAVTLFTLDYFREVGESPILFLAMGSLTVALTPLCFWKLRRIKTDESTE